MFNIGPGELMVILILALVLLGPERLPEVARTIGKGMKELRKASEEIRETVEQEIYRADSPGPKAPPPFAALPAASTVPFEPEPAPPLAPSDPGAPKA